MNSNELYHFGVKGMKWGVRRYQNKDGTLTAEGRKRLNSYINSDGTYTKKGLQKGFDKKIEKGVKTYISGKKINDPLVAEVIRQNKSQIDSMILAERIKQQEIVRRHQEEGIRFMQEQAMISQQQARQAASLAATNGMNPFLY